ncbi:PREDICTED: inactive peptidyl-prolyl cis-trans isomerase FKBP6-like [Wasmannia auropunctata]|uniref:inactive peptidyl-prolyl cis-trans isomerase FKBP6-like n=1 Tax=Wasmannia auropunctata TaxID=64793 RepID=UPI0005EFAE91|nr:PREDICTED: inactive peptidyl-prolyl cis-trans isomerase FKBP6-like [Wasmannia auropunctata]
MAKYLESLMDGLKISDLIKEGGITFDLGDGDEINNEDDEEFAYSPNVQFSNEEMLNMLNMNDFEDEDEDNENGPVSLCGISFSKLKKQMTNLTADQKVMKFVKQKGVGEVIPKNAQVTVHYVGYFEYRDEPFDSTYSSGRPRTLRLGQHFVIPGLEIGLCSMQKHEIAVFLMHPDYAYKAKGCPPRVPPNEEVVFVVHLIDYVDDGCAQTYQNLNEEEKRLFSCVKPSIMHMFATAKDYCNKYNYKLAIREYKKITDRLEAVKNASMTELQKALVLDPRNEAIRKAIQTTNVKQREYLEVEKRLWKNCFKSKEEQNKITEFRKAARELCNKLIESNDMTRQSLYEGFTEEEYEIIHEEAAKLGLDFLKSSRYGKKTAYIQKNKS